MMRRIGQLTAALVLAALVALVPAVAVAGGVPAESHVLGSSKVTLHVYPFLDPTELATLRLVMTNRQALDLFLPEGGAGGYAAIAVAPGEGFIRNGKPVPSATALGGLGDERTADAKATQACDSKRAPGGAPCVVVLEVAPNG